MVAMLPDKSPFDQNNPNDVIKHVNPLHVPGSELELGDPGIAPEIGAINGSEASYYFDDKPKPEEEYHQSEVSLMFTCLI